MRAMVLAAGLGTRLRPVTYAMPKPMVPVVNRPVMEHTAPSARPPWLHRDDRQPALVPGADRGPLRRRLRASASSSPTATRSSCWAPREGSATSPTSSATRFSSSPATPSPTSTWRRCGSSTSPMTGSRRWRRNGSPTPSEFGVVITGDDGRIQGFQEKPDPAEALSDLANCGIYMFRSAIFDYFPEPGTSKAAGPDDPRLRRLGAGRLSGAARGRPSLLLARDRRLLERHRQPRRAAPGELRCPARRGRGRARRPRDRPRRALGQPPRRGRGSGPVLVGEGVEFGEGVRIAGPAIVGNGCRIGEGAYRPGGDPARRHRATGRGMLSAASRPHREALVAFLTNRAPPARGEPRGWLGETAGDGERGAPADPMRVLRAPLRGRSRRLQRLRASALPRGPAPRRRAAGGRFQPFGVFPP